MSASTLFDRYGKTEPARWLGDLPFFRRIERLRPLVEGPLEAVSLTAMGHDVLAGSLDRLDVAAPDHWLGGTHLKAGRIWRWDAVAQRLSLD